MTTDAHLLDGHHPHLLTPRNEVRFDDGVLAPAPSSAPASSGKTTVDSVLFGLFVLVAVDAVTAVGAVVRDICVPERL